jgi:hypothetical protein
VMFFRCVVLVQRLFIGTSHLAPRRETRQVQPRDHAPADETPQTLSGCPPRALRALSLATRRVEDLGIRVRGATVFEGLAPQPEPAAQRRGSGAFESGGEEC